MEPSPLSRQAPPSFQPKIIAHYNTLFSSDPDPLTDGFWTELFLLQPSRPALATILASLSPSVLLNHAATTQELVLRAIAVLRGAVAPKGLRPARGATSRTTSPSPLASPRLPGSPMVGSASVSVPVANPAAVVNTLTTLSVFFSVVLSKKFTHHSETITVVAGLDSVDAVFTELVGLLEALVRTAGDNRAREGAVEVLLAITSGAWGGTLATYLIQRDLFPAVMKYIYDVNSATGALRPFTLVSLLSNYNKFEFRNPYGLRLADFINESTITVIVRSIGATCARLRSDYIAIQDDAPEGWTLASTLGLLTFGLGQKKKKQDKVVDPETAKKMFAELPGTDAPVVLAAYDFAFANKLFCVSFVTLPAETPSPSPPSSGSPLTPPATPEHPSTPFSSFLSLSTYLLQHAYLSHRASYYATLSLMTIRLLVEDPAICKRLCASESLTTVRLCRHRPPYLPVLKTPRVLAAHVLDAMTDALAHNLRKRLDVPLYTLTVGIVLRLLSYLSRTRTRVGYHWGELFRSLLSLVRFLTQYAADLKDLPNITTLTELVVNVLALALSAGESFLPTPAAYDDLFYKIVESGDILEKFRTVYSLPKSSSVSTLVDVSAHYKTLLSQGTDKGQLTAMQVAETIRTGYETLSIQTKEGLDMWERFREADERVLLKKAARTAVGDVKGMLERSNR